MLTASTSEKYFTLVNNNDGSFCLREQAVEVEVYIPQNKIIRWLYLTSQISGKSMESLIIQAIQAKVALKEWKQKN